MKTIKCNKCGETNITKFSPSRLKNCDYICHHCNYIRNKKSIKKWKEANPEKIREYARNYMRVHPGKNREAFAIWYAKAENKEKHLLWRLASAKDNSQMHNAQSMALRIFPDAQPCENCEESGERHHDDYNKPKEIRWLCKKHHKELHIRITR